MRKKLLSLLVLLMVAVTGAWADADVTWNSSNVSDIRFWGGAPDGWDSYTKEGITLRGNAEQCDAEWADFGNGPGIMFAMNAPGGYTFTAPDGKKFTKIEITATTNEGWYTYAYFSQLESGWPAGEAAANDFNSTLKFTWTGSAASVNLATTLNSFGPSLASSIDFYFEAPAEPVASWVGNSAINANGTWYYAGNNFGWCTGGAFNGADLGTITTLSLGGQSQAWADGNANWNDGNLTMTMGYKIDGGADQSLSLNWFEFADNNNKFQSGGSSWAAQDIDISGLTPGNHTIAVWFTRDDKWDSNNSANYVANFTIPTPAATTYTVTVKEGTEDADKWTADPNPAEAGQTVTVTYSGLKKVKSVKAVKKAPAGPTYNETKSINDGPVTVAAGEHWLITGTGTQTSNAMSIGAGATVTLDGVNISSGGYCIKCAGDATIILKDGSTNTLTSTGDALLPALSIGDANTTLTIQGSTGVLNVESGDYCAGIGGGYSNTNSTCGNIRIEGGVITVQGGYGGAGIGTDVGEATCGDIIITGGTITANGGGRAAGIGGGTSDYGNTVCGNITIANTVTKVTATAGNQAPYSIGKGYGSNASCGTITIGGTTGAITESPYTYAPSAAPAGPTAYSLAESTVGMIVGSDGLAYAAADKDNLPTGVTAVAIVAYLGDGDTSDNTYNNGLAIAMTNANDGSGCGWGDYFVSYNCVSKSNDIATAIGFKDGISSTNTLTSDGHYHEAATAAASNNGTAAPTGTSGWFLPSIGQWNLIVQGLASKKAGSAVTTDISTSGNDTYTASNLNSVITDAGGTGFNGGYQSSTQYDSDDCWHMDISSGRASNYVFYAGDYVRSVLAF